MPAGRPTDYGDDVLDKSVEYLTSYEEIGDQIPSVVGLCKYIRRSRACVYRWASEEGKEEFKDILEEINETQSQVLINKGLSGDFNSNITKLVLGKHGFHEKQDHEVSGPNGGAINVSTTERSARIAAILDSGRDRRDRQADNDRSVDASSGTTSPSERESS